MALWNEKPTPANAGPAVSPSVSMPPPERTLAERSTSDAALAVSPRRPTPKTSSEGGESVIAANLTIEGKIEGSGNVKMAGRFSIFGLVDPCGMWQVSHPSMRTEACS